MFNLQFPTGLIQGTVQLPISKSLINRQLILAAQVGNFPDMSDAALPEDVRLLADLLRHPGPVWDAGAGGTTLRFLTAFLALSGKDGIVTGSSRMQQRPISPLMHVLEQLGVQYHYSGITGCPPILLNGFSGQQAIEVHLDPGNSSQFLSALLLVSPMLPLGLTIHLTGPITSKPYFDMTLAVMKHWGVHVEVENTRLLVRPQAIQSRELVLEADWTAASYFYGILALAPVSSTIFFPGLRLSGLQGDQILSSWMTAFGIDSTEQSDGIIITRNRDVRPDRLNLDFKAQPDLAQTMVVLCAILGIPGTFTGLQTLRIKETDRIAALQQELARVGVRFEPDQEHSEGWQLTGKPYVDLPRFATYHDHRMAMAFSLMSISGPIRIEDPEVVIKSYPHFWENLKAIGFRVEPD